MSPPPPPIIYYWSRPDLHVAAVFKAGLVVASRIAAAAAGGGAAAAGEGLGQINAALLSSVTSISGINAPMATQGDEIHVEAVKPVD